MLQTHVLGQGVNSIKLFKIGLSTFCATTLRTLTSCPHATMLLRTYDQQLQVYRAYAD